MGQGYDTRPLLFTERNTIILALLLALLLGRIQCPKLVVPFRLEGIGDEPVRGVYVKVASLSQISLVPGARPVSCAGGPPHPIWFESLAGR